MSDLVQRARDEAQAVHAHNMTLAAYRRGAIAAPTLAATCLQLCDEVERLQESLRRSERKTAAEILLPDRTTKRPERDIRDSIAIVDSEEWQGDMRWVAVKLSGAGRILAREVERLRAESNVLCSNLCEVRRISDGIQDENERLQAENQQARELLKIACDVWMGFEVRPEWYAKAKELLGQ